MTKGILRASQGGAKRVRYFGKFRGQAPRGWDFGGSRGYQGRLVQVVLQSLDDRSSDSAVQEGHQGKLRVCYVCDESGHVAKHCPCHMIRAIHISAVKGRGATWSARGKGSGAHGGGRGATQPGDGCGQCYSIPGRPEVEALDTMITGIIPICFRPITMLFDPVSNFSYVSTYFALGFDFFSEPLAMLIRVSTPVRYSLVVDRVHDLVL